jgi:hypothetical protein
LTDMHVRCAVLSWCRTLQKYVIRQLSNASAGHVPLKVMEENKMAWQMVIIIRRTDTGRAPKTIEAPPTMMRVPSDLASPQLLQMVIICGRVGKGVVPESKTIN